jgi:small subunit ribosomal protein S9
MAERKKATPKKTKTIAPTKPRVRKSVAKPTVKHDKPVVKESHAIATPHHTGKRTYVMAVGRRKSAIARVRYSEKGSGLFIVNSQDVNVYFPTFDMRKIVNDPFELLQYKRAGDISIKVLGGGKHGQAEAVRLGLSRLLVGLNLEYRTPLKRAGFLTRDPRVKERKKYGLKRARRAPQWQKR